MKIYNNTTLDTYIEDSSGVVCIGGFDGIHLAHQQLFKKTMNISTKFDIVTFEVIPKIYFNEDLKPLISNEGRERIFSTFNPQNLVYLNFENFNKISQEQFCNYLKNNLKVKKIVVGKDFKFGKNRSGDITTLIHFFGEENIFLLDDFLIDNEKVSSTKIRYYLSNGDIEKANNYLGREFSLIGTVIEGKKIGRSIGFPTANLSLDQDTFIPNFGVYTGKIYIDNNIFNTIVNIGLNPTVDDQATLKIEAHIFDFSSDIYNSKVEISLSKFIRKEIKFKNIDELKDQISEDIKTAKKYF
ncbi:MAG: bifunctional riboflavin kinase/FAD synthetase [Candidatus Actinomarina sp.]